MLFRSAEVNFVDRFLICAMVHKLSSAEHDIQILLQDQKDQYADVGLQPEIFQQWSKI